MTLLQIVFAALFGTLSNFAMRKNILSKGAPSAFLVLQLSISLLVILFLNPIRTGLYQWDNSSAILGITTGLVLALMLLALGYALSKGPAGLTFAILNSACVMPAIVMSVLFGEDYGYNYTAWNILGSALVVGGLLWAGKSSEAISNKQRWAYLAIMAFGLHILLMGVMQWRALMLEPIQVNSSLLLFQLHPESSQWFMPILFLTATLIHVSVFYFKERRWPKQKELFWGFVGGTANGMSMFFLLLATESAQGWEKAILFPISSVLTILLCNLWAQRLHHEEINWKANALCSMGIFVAAISAF